MHMHASYDAEIQHAEIHMMLKFNVVSRISIILHSLHVQLMRRTPTAYHCHGHGHAQTWSCLSATPVGLTKFEHEHDNGNGQQL